MLGFLISTIAFSAAAYAMNRYFEAQALDKTNSRKILVLMVATVISIGTGWLVDNLDGDAKLPQKNISFVDVLRSGDPMQIAMMLVRIN